MSLEKLTTEELRAMAAKTGISRIGWNEWTREMLVAFFKNRQQQLPATTFNTETING